MEIPKISGFESRSGSGLDAKKEAQFLKQVSDVTHLAQDYARFLLEDCNWNVEKAIQTFYDHPEKYRFKEVKKRGQSSTSEEKQVRGRDRRSTGKRYSHSAPFRPYKASSIDQPSEKYDDGSSTHEKPYVAEKPRAHVVPITEKSLKNVSGWGSFNPLVDKPAPKPVPKREPRRKPVSQPKPEKKPEVKHDIPEKIEELKVEEPVVKDIEEPIVETPIELPEEKKEEELVTLPEEKEELPEEKVEPEEEEEEEEERRRGRRGRTGD
ncbi:hypothetical protein ADUPG1_008375 [Aduncisulcus paluster]|uniref:Uncharacterized protein n=1 Tax=Aduncisulcus paluster TaxID=2918883 RepID=A0ABQ5KUQ7_9EUKA|nr:hypothetical protein ADUPG1_008375 [Aduncisulcus paluster]